MDSITKRLLRNLIQVLAFTMIVSLLSAAHPAQADVKVATINFKNVVEHSPQYITASKNATEKFNKRQSSIDAVAKKLDEDAGKFEQTQNTLSADDRQNTEKDLQTRQLDLQYAQKQLQDDLTARNHELTNQLVAQIGKVVGQIAQEKHYDLVLIDPAYAYAASSTDISDEILKRLNALPTDLN